MKTDLRGRMTTIHADHSPALLRFLLRLTNGERQTAEDLVQETMLRAWRRADSLPADDEGVRRWLFTIARRLMIDVVRMRQCRPPEVRDVDLTVLRSPDDTVGTVIAGRSVVHAFGALSPAHRDVLAEVYLRGNTPEEVAVRLGVPVGTVKSRTHYAMRALRSGMSDY